MPPQHVEIAETILALKRALRREKEAPSDQPISSATNRGNKLKRGANFVHSGSLPYRYGSHGYKEKIEHAGYQRYILERNPKRYNGYGDELEESESDEGADAEADDENPYSDIRLEELLRPLTHPAELANHPTFSLPYLDSALPDMVKNTEAQLRQERANLWRAKNLHRQFIGDESWMPCERAEASDDWDLFEPHQPGAGLSSSRNRKRANEEQMAENGVAGQDHAKNNAVETNGVSNSSLTNGVAKRADSDTIVVSQEGQKPALENGVAPDPKAAEDQKMEDQTDISIAGGGKSKSNGLPPTENQNAENPTIDKAMEDSKHIAEEANDLMVRDEDDKNNRSESEDIGPPLPGDTSEDEGPPPLPTRRITRALAAADTSNAPTPPLSPTTSTISSLSSSLLQPAPLFLLPPNLTLAHTPHPVSHLPLHVAHSGLPIDEIIETRRLLGMFIQKQEETIRGLEGVLGKLIKAKRMKDRVWEWCKAEGHVGEWSDGEDWVDADAWGLRPEELRKGRDEEEQEVQEEGRKGKRRRGREQ